MHSVQTVFRFDYSWYIFDLYNDDSILARVLSSKLLQQSLWYNFKDFDSTFKTFKVFADEWNKFAIGTFYAS